MTPSTSPQKPHEPPQKPLKVCSPQKPLKVCCSPSPQKPNEPPSQTPYSAKLVEWFNNIAPKFITIIDAQQLEQGDENPLAGHDQQWEAFYSQLDKQKVLWMYLGSSAAVRLSSVSYSMRHV